MNWNRFFRRGETDLEQREELDFYVDTTAQEYIERGMEPAEARAAAAASFDVVGAGGAEPTPVPDGSIELVIELL